MSDSNVIMKSITSFFTSFIMPDVGAAVKEFRKKTDDIPFWKLLSDFLFVARGLWFFLFFDFLVFVFFILLPQGSDILLAVLEDTGNKFLGTIFFLIIGIIGWSIIAEFGSRYTMYVTDNSGYSLSDERVEWRKFLQRFFARFFLYYPSAIILIGLVIVALTNFPVDELKTRWDILGTLGVLYFVFMFLYKLYSPRKKDGNPADASEKPADASERTLPEEQKRPKWLQLSKNEEEWASKLYGIYNDYVYKYPAKEVLNEKDLDSIPFTESIDRKTTIKGYNVNVVSQPDENRNREYYLEYPNKESEEEQEPEKAGVQQNSLLNWPQTIAGNETVLKVNDRFILFRFAKRSDDIWARWFYKIPLRFYRKLHNQLLILVALSVIFLVIFSLIGNQAYQSIGAAGLVIISFACWCGIYVGLIFLDKAQLKIKANWRLLLFLWVIFCSVVNNDHPARINSSDLNINSQRPGLKEHFTKWMADFKNDPNSNIPDFPELLNSSKIDHAHNDSLKKDTVYPVIFVCAEGGASRTGAFTAMMLSRLQDSFSVFNRKIYAFSSVSGGTLGVGVYNAIANFRKRSNGDKFSDTVHATLTRKFFSRDHLSAAIGKLFFCEILQAFWPVHVAAFDRAIALEESWEWGYEKAAVLNNDENVFSTDYFRVYDPKKIYPAWFINTTSVETGLQCWLSNVIPDSLMPAFEERDLWRHVTGTTLYSTAINFSSRFPIISPSAMISEGNILRRHYVDGGYVENCGTQTMYEVLYSLHADSLLKKEHVRPIVLMLEFGSNDNQRPAGTKFGNDWADILVGIYNTRSGRGTVAKNNLRYLTQDILHGKLIEIPFDESGKKVPLNWILSNKAVNNISSYCDTMIKNYKDIQWLKQILLNKPGVAVSGPGVIAKK